MSNPIGNLSWCVAHGKKTFASRKTARRAIRLLHDTQMREYRCDHADGLWHIGHLPQATLRGRMTTREVYAAGRVRR